MLKRIWWERRRISPKESSGLLRLKNLLHLEKSYQSSEGIQNTELLFCKDFPQKLELCLKEKNKHETMVQVLPLLSHSGSFLCQYCKREGATSEMVPKNCRERDVEVALTDHRTGIF